jgi:hypothetical protein
MLLGLVVGAGLAPSRTSWRRIRRVENRGYGTAPIGNDLRLLDAGDPASRPPRARRRQLRDLRNLGGRPALLL